MNKKYILLPGFMVLFGGMSPAQAAGSPSDPILSAAVQSAVQQNVRFLGDFAPQGQVGAGVVAGAVVVEENNDDRESPDDDDDDDDDSGVGGGQQGDDDDGGGQQQGSGQQQGGGQQQGSGQQNDTFSPEPSDSGDNFGGIGGGAGNVNTFTNTVTTEQTGSQQSQGGTVSQEGYNG